jgi:transposase InsO family protein
MSRSARLSVALPARWPKSVRSAVVHAMSLAAATLTATRGWAADHVSSRVRLRAELERLRQEVSLLQEEMRLKDCRTMRVPGHERPHFHPIERLAILELRAVRGWSVRQTANRFLLSPATLSSWVRRLDERGPAAIVQSRAPLNKFPDFVAHIVQQLRLLCPSLGYARIAHFLCRAGLHLGKSTVRRMLRRVAAPEPEPAKRKAATFKRIVARYPHHAWHCDLTTVPTSMGLWVSAFPFALPQRWPFCWWLVVLADQYSCRIMSLAEFRKRPSAEDVRGVVARTARSGHAFPKYLITDRGEHFRALVFRTWCKRSGVRHLFGALGQIGSIPFIERLIQTIKSECTRRLMFPYSASAARKELALFRIWYNRVRPHWRLQGATPDEIHDRARPFWDRARFEPRARWPRGSPCASPPSRIAGRCGARLVLHVGYLEGRKHLPIVALRRVA